jgi:hypothetical protein
VGQAKLEEAGSELGPLRAQLDARHGRPARPASEVLPKYDEDLGLDARGLARAAGLVSDGAGLRAVDEPRRDRRPGRDGDESARMAHAARRPSAPSRRSTGAPRPTTEIRLARENSLDYYVSLRDAYIQHRTRQIRGDYVTRLLEGQVADRSAAVPDDIYEPPETERARRATDRACS